MAVDIQVSRVDAAGRCYLTWAPVGATVRQTPAASPLAVTVANAPSATGGRVEFATARDKPRTSTIDLVLPADGQPVPFWLAGAFGRPSSTDADTTIQVTAGGAPVASTRVMVRIRKDANTLSPAERQRFTTALAQLNDRGAGPFRAFREMHRQQIALDQAHGAPGFLSWHRAYLLDLERELQRLDPSVTLPYWRFDRPAPQVFTPDFLGGTRPGGTTVVFSSTNLLRHWRTDNAPGISRSPRFDPATRGAFVSDEATTLLMGGNRPTAVFDTGGATDGFDDMEGDPHGFAHTSFTGFVRSASTAPRDPLFFLLHCNVDRLWARWQWFHDRFDGTRPDTFFFRGSATSVPRTTIGHNLRDTMWPWNGVTGGPRPATVPRPPLRAVPTATAPPPSPTVGDMIDYAGGLPGGGDMNVGYDDVPFGVAP